MLFADITPPEVALHVLITLAAVIALGFVLTRLLNLIGQPPVIAEMLAGILLGPSLLGLISPEAMAFLIPPTVTDPDSQVLSTLRILSQLGIVLYMFMVGLELNAPGLKSQAKIALTISSASIVAPLVLGIGLSFFLQPVFSPVGVPFTTFALFIGVAMAITAFPVLARILTDMKQEKTELGILALACAAVGDVIAWCLLAMVISMAKVEAQSAVGMLIGTMLFLVVILCFIRPLFVRVAKQIEATPGPPSTIAVLATVVTLMTAAFAADAIGIHAVFGAFLFGLIIPHEGKLARVFISGRWIKWLISILLPAFFATTGMRMQLNLISGVENWFWCGLVIAVATLGKFGGTIGAGRFTGMTWRNAAALGALLNTRGLMELIVLNIGLDLGVISPALFAIMVVMALVTTAATSPGFKLFLNQTH